MSKRHNPARAARTKALAHPGAVVTVPHPAGDVLATITKVTDASVYATYSVRESSGGMTERTMRFTQRTDGEYRQVGKGPYYRPLRFNEEH